MATRRSRSFSRVLIANRGEIAVRLIRGCREAGLESVAVYSDADERALHVRLADRAERLGPGAPSESYLNIDALIAAAHRGGAQAIHPGYGFLSERSAFARAVESAGLVFIGPPADVIERMGSKIGARELMTGAGVPIVPGETPADQSDDGVAAAALERAERDHLAAGRGRPPRVFRPRQSVGWRWRKRHAHGPGR